MAHYIVEEQQRSLQSLVEEEEALFQCLYPRCDSHDRSWEQEQSLYRPVN